MFLHADQSNPVRAQIIPSEARVPPIVLFVTGRQFKIGIRGVGIFWIASLQGADATGVLFPKYIAVRRCGGVMTWTPKEELLSKSAVLKVKK